MTTITDRQLQSLRNMGCEFEDAANEIEELREALSAPATAPEQKKWRAMVYAPLDGTKITLLIRHTTWWTAHKCDPAKANIWEAECEGHWIDFNGGGWTWAGMAGTPIGWRALKDAE